MLTIIPKVLNEEELKQFQTHLDKADWRDGGETAGSLARQVKKNQQLDDTTEIAIRLGTRILKRLGENSTFVSASLADRIYPPKFNRYTENQAYGAHVDASLMYFPNSTTVLRTDLSATLFLTDPNKYDGGELIIETQYGPQSVKLPAGDMVLYPATSLHQVSPITHGTRIGAFFWIQSMVRDIEQREILHQLDNSVQSLTKTLGATHQEVVKLSGLYHNLLRQWATPS